MSSSSVVIRGGLGVNDVRPFREAELAAVLDRPAQGAGEEGSATPVGAPAPPTPEQAEREAQALIERARTEAEAIREGAYQDGLVQGRERAREEARQEILASLVALSQAAQSLIVLEEQLVSAFTPEIVRLALEIAEKIVAKEVREDPEIVASVTERARAEVPHAKRVTIWLHPEDHRLLAELRPDLVSTGAENGRTVEIVASNDISRGGCRVETEMGTIDAAVPTQIGEISRQLLDE